MHKLFGSFIIPNNPAFALPCKTKLQPSPHLIIIVICLALPLYPAVPFGQDRGQTRGGDNFAYDSENSSQALDVFGTGAQGPAEQGADTIFTEMIRRAGMAIGRDERQRAAQILEGLIRECDSGYAGERECGRWSEAVKGLLSLIREKEGIGSFVENSLNMKMVRIPAGEYMMGSLDREMDWLRLTFKKIWREGHKQWFQDELPLHPVKISKPFYMSATEVTVGQFKRFVEDANYRTDAQKGDGGMIFSKKEGRWVPRKKYKWNSTPWQISEDQPVVFVSWNDAKAFCRWLSRKEKRNYRLPTEAEWEMACRAGSVWARYPWGARLPGDGDTNFGDGNPKLPESLTTVDDGYQYVSPVGSFPPNAFGLYDMAGNVMEWVEDRYGRNYYDNSPINDPRGASSGVSRVNKGGNWYASPSDSRCAFRGFSGPEMSFWNLGFRVVMEIEPELQTASSKADRKDQPQKEEIFPPGRQEGVTLFREAMLSAQQRQWDQAVEALERALEIYEKRGDYKWIARVKATLAGIYAERNRTYKSKELYTKALADFRKIGDTVSARVILARLQELETSPGVRVVKLKKGGAADRAGIVEDDVIVEYAGQTGFRVKGFTDLVEDYSRTPEVTLSVMNDNEISTVVVPGGPLGVAVEDMKRPPRPEPPPRERRDRRQRRGRR
jgi:formylglycine-generating enzyme required for sulfatase activity